MPESSSQNAPRSAVPGSSPGAKVAVIGGGIAGLCAAWMLGERNRVTLYERLPEPGMGAHGIDVPGLGSTPRLDVPIRTFYEGYYPQLAALYRRLGIATEPVDFASTYASLEGEIYLRYRNLRWGGLTVPWVMAPWRRSARRIVAGLLRFRRQTAAALRRGELGEMTFGDFLDREEYASELVDQLLLPLFAVICTCSYDDVRRFPAAVFAEYFERGVFWEAMRRPVLGTPEVVERLLSRLAENRCGVGVEALVETSGGLEVRDEKGRRDVFEHVVVATQANQARDLIAPLDPHLAGLLDAFRYDWIRVVTHTDATLMPPKRRHWSPINAAISRDHDRPMATLWLDAIQPSLGLEHPVFQTVHPLREPAPEKVLGSADFERPVVDARSERALARLEELQARPGRRLWLCGSYAARGIPLLESAVTSASTVAEHLAVQA